MSEIFGSGVAFPLQVDRRGGVPVGGDQARNNDTALVPLRAALDRWEPRVEVTDVQFDLDGTDRGELVIQIAYRVRATNHVRNLVYPFYVIPAEEGAE